MGSFHTETDCSKQWPPVSCDSASTACSSLSSYLSLAFSHLCFDHLQTFYYQCFHVGLPSPSNYFLEIIQQISCSLGTLFFSLESYVIGYIKWLKFKRAFISLGLLWCCPVFLPCFSKSCQTLHSFGKISYADPFSSLQHSIMNNLLYIYLCCFIDVSLKLQHI